MRVAHVICRYYPNIGGQEALVKELNDGLVQKGLSVAVYAFDRDRSFPRKKCIDGVSVTRYRSIVGDPFYLPSPSFLKDLRNGPATVIHVHDIHSLLPLIVTVLKRRDQKILLQPYYHRFGQGFVRQLLLSIYRRLLNALVLPHIPLIVAISRHEGNAINADFPRSRKIILVPGGVAIQELRRFKWNPVHPKRILYAGGLRKYKNIDKLIHAFSLLLGTQGEELRLVIDGDGPERAHLMRLAHDLGVSKYVEWKCSLTRHELFAEYAKAQVFVLLSPLESFSRVVREALIIGVPTIVLNMGPAAELVKTGIVEGVNSTKKEELAQAISKELRTKRTKVSLKQLSALDMDAYADEFIKLYKSVQN